VPERSNGLAWKACVPHKGTEGSNPSPSASFPLEKLTRAQPHSRSHSSRLLERPLVSAPTGLLCRMAQHKQLPLGTGTFCAL
jgi:hypothetical protein